ncbi:MAG: hypothetical protein ABI439_12115 [Rhodospirillales bacterium]
MSLYTLSHVVLSMIGIAVGWAALFGGPYSRRSPGLAALFLVSTLLTSLTGLGFLVATWRVGIGHVTAVLSLVALCLAFQARYRHRLAGAWRWIYVAAAVAALYLNVFIVVMQAFAKLPVLRKLAPSLDAAPFLATHLGVLAIFIVLGALAVRHAINAPANAPRPMPRPDAMLRFLTEWRFY